MSLRRLAMFAAAVLIMTTAACKDDDPAGPEGPTPTLDNVWPHADGDTWEYGVLLKTYSRPEADLEITALPDMETLHAQLMEPVSTSSLGTATGLYRLAFDGTVTTGSGVTAQHLVEALVDDDAKARATVSPFRYLVTGRWPHPAAQGKQDDDDVRPADLDSPALLPGYAFDATEQGLYSYGDISTHHSWVYLESDLDVGHEFSMQLIPELADDLWLHGRIWSHADVTIGDRTFLNCVECFYVIDLGIQSATDESGNVLFSGRSYIYGSVHYAPDTGPVRCRERRHGMGDPILQDPPPMIVDIRADLSGTNVGPEDVD